MFSVISKEETNSALMTKQISWKPFPPIKSLCEEEGEIPQGNEWYQCQTKAATIASNFLHSCTQYMPFLTIAAQCHTSECSLTYRWNTGKTERWANVKVTFTWQWINSHANQRVYPVGSPPIFHSPWKEAISFDSSWCSSCKAHINSQSNILDFF